MTFAQHSHPNSRLLKAVALVTTLLVLVMGTVVSAQANNPHLRISQVGRTHAIEVGLNKSMIVDLPHGASEVIVTQPSIVAAIMRDRSRAIVQGVSSGSTNVLFLDGNGNSIATLEVTVVSNSGALSAAIARIVPNSNITIDAFGESVVLSGTARSSDDVQKAIAVAAQFAGGEQNVASVITVDGAQQVMLKVTVAEVSREVVKQMGLNLNMNLNIGGLTTGLISNPALGGAANVVPSNSISAGGNIGGLGIQATLRALERRGAVRTLAEPTLTALSGQQAEFMAGGQFPVPSGVDGDTVVFEFKDFGVKLNFLPVVKSNGVVSLTVETDVSEPTTEGGFNAGSVTIPATKQRHAKTSVEMMSGSTLAIAGLIEDKVRQQINQLPGIGNVPILGALFRSRDFIHSQTELLILVTPYLAEPGNMVQLPTDRFQVAGDAEAVFLGHMQRLYGVGEAGSNQQYNGTVGFILD